LEIIPLPDEAKVSDSDQGVEALARIAAAREVALEQSNRFLLFGIASTIFYTVKVFALRIDIVLFDTKIFEIPYGLFVFALAGTIVFALAQ
jgi:hypothetical protein